tara:strand:+ start:544 stop:1083 length:540 start_codon:yes stop_codon:yes gene_type:complete
MKTFFIPFCIAMALFACNSGEQSLNDTETNSDNAQAVWSYYGEEIPGGMENIMVQDAPQMIAKTGTAVGLFEAEIVQSCQTMGCWMTVKSSEQEPLRVFMKDHAFFVPKDSLQGKLSYFYGEAFYDTVSVDLQKHLLEDAGATTAEIEAIIEPTYELTFEAAGVMIADVPAGAPMAGDE